MQRKFVINLILLIFLNLLIKPFYILGVDTEFIVRLGQEEYGNYFALLNLSFLLNIFLDFGVVNFNTGNIARHEHLIGKHLSNIMGLRMLLSVAYCFLTILVALVLGYREQNIYLIMLLCVNQILAGFILYFRSNLAGLQLFLQDGLLSVLDRLILIILASSLLWADFFNLPVTIEWFIYLQTIAYGMGAVIGFGMVLRQAGRAHLRFNIPFSYLILKKSFPYALLVLLMGFYYRTDGVMLERMLDDGAREAGIYAQAFRFFEAGNMMAYIFAALLFPLFSRLLSEKKDVAELLGLSFRIISVGAIIAGLAGFRFADEIMDLRYGSEIETSARSFRLLMIGFTGVCGTYVFGALLTANGNLRSLNIMAVSGVLINIVLNFILIPRFRSEGASLASMITQLLMTVLQIYLVKRNLDIIPRLSVWIRLLVFCVVSILILYAFSFTVLNWKLVLILYTVLCIAFSITLKLLSIRNFAGYVKLSQTLRTQ